MLFSIKSDSGMHYYRLVSVNIQRLVVKTLSCQLYISWLSWRLSISCGKTLLSGRTFHKQFGQSWIQIATETRWSEIRKCSYFRSRHFKSSNSAAPNRIQWKLKNDFGMLAPPKRSCLILHILGQCNCENQEFIETQVWRWILMKATLKVNSLMSSLTGDLGLAFSWWAARAFRSSCQWPTSVLY